MKTANQLETLMKAALRNDKMKKAQSKRRLAVAVRALLLLGCGVFMVVVARRTQHLRQTMIVGPDERVITASDSQSADGTGILNVGWNMLRGLNYRTGKRTPELQGFDGKIVKIPGYMVPLEDNSESVTEFLLVPYLGACIHTPPPPPNQIVHVKMKGSEKAKSSLSVPVWVQGKLDITTVKSPYGDVSFEMSAESVRPFKRIN